jgi:hypothetical protein
VLVPLKAGGGYRDKDALRADPVGIVNAEGKALVAACAQFIQIDQAHHGMHAGSVHDVTRHQLRRVRAKIAVHVCFGNRHGRPVHAVRDYRNVFPTRGDLKPPISSLPDRARVRRATARRSCVASSGTSMVGFRPWNTGTPASTAGPTGSASSSVRSPGHRSARTAATSSPSTRTRRSA